MNLVEVKDRLETDGAMLQCPVDRRWLYDQLCEAIRIIEMQQNELRELVRDEQCDHDVNICWCSTFDALDHAQAFLQKMDKGTS